ncbi:hypothetical protein PR202_gb16289 [Eleusine coracana subsp. coracana]|uniref:F-box domain-containing protein n=1 Tax=Eleusine coracana subsp. coracana TaxID=191504 RepID=A0AAV5F0N7_ELECO|nr:hypothetical protein PR202_gb16289 [Eleusine coracana subsp. coracana]
MWVAPPLRPAAAPGEVIAKRSEATIISASSSACYLIDRMPHQGQSDKKAPVASGSHTIDALPVIVLEHILGFLPAQEAVQTSVLARRWRHLWKSATGLHVSCIVDLSGYSASLKQQAFKER